MTEKTRLREAALARRDALALEIRIEAALALPDLFPFDQVDVRGRWVSAFLPIRSEIDARPLMDAVRERGGRLCLPVFETRTAPMSFRALERGAPLVPMGFGTSGPGPEAATVTPDILLVPLSAFDRHLNRIGYGKGHYDRALAGLDALGRRLAIGLAFSVQEVDEVPVEPHDRPLDMIVTENGVRSAHAPSVSR